MTITNRFDTISPLDSRFYGGDPAVYKSLHPYLSAAAAIKYMARVEGALALALADLGITDKNIANAIASVADRITAQEVADEETRTRHDVRALVNVIRNQVPDEAKRFVHLGATSYDIVDTANALRYRECTDRVVAPTIAVLIAKCISIAEAEADTAQIGRTHGRHAEPVTFGFAMAEYVSRLGDRLEQLRLSARRLPGKLSGAVGAYNALALLAADPRALERRFLGSLQLHPAPVATQIVPPEGWTDLAMSRGAIAAEPLYVLLAKYGHPDAHEAVRRLTLEAERGSRSLLEVATLDGDLRPYLVKFTPDERRILERPEEYRGLAPEVAADLGSAWR